MTSSEYIDGAIRTESGRFDAINVQPELIQQVFGLFVAAGQALDQVKRALYYGKPLNEQKLHAAMMKARHELNEYDKPSNVPVDLKGYSSTPAVSARVVHAGIGLGTEAAEVVEKLLLSFETGEDFDYANFFEELGDSQWYTALGINEASKLDPKSIDSDEGSALFNKVKNLPMGGPVDPECGKEYLTLRKWAYETIWERNLGKLKARYPDKFATENAYKRDLSAEQKALDGVESK